MTWGIARYGRDDGYIYILALLVVKGFLGGYYGIDDGHIYGITVE